MDPRCPLNFCSRRKKCYKRHGGTGSACCRPATVPYCTHIALAHEIHFLGTSHFIRCCFPFRREEPLTAAHGPVSPLNTITFRRTRGIDKSGEPLTARAAGLADICSKSLRIYEFHGVYRTALSLFLARFLGAFAPLLYSYRPKGQIVAREEKVLKKRKKVGLLIWPPSTIYTGNIHLGRNDQSDSNQSP